MAEKILLLEAPKTGSEAQAVPTEVDKRGAKAHDGVIGALDAVSEYPTFKRDVVSFSPDSAAALKAELGLRDGDVLVGLPPEAGDKLGYKHGEKVELTLDGKTVFMAGRPITIVTRTPKNGDLRNIGLSKGIRDIAGEGFKDHRETTNKVPDKITFTVAMIGDKKYLHIQKGETVAPVSTPE